MRRWFIERRRRDKQDAARNIQGGNGSAQRTDKGKSKMKKKKNLSSLEPGEHGSCTRKPGLVQDMLYSPDYIFMKIFRKDGPPLGVEFDPLPDTVFQGSNGIAGWSLLFEATTLLNFIFFSSKANLMNQSF